MNSETSRGVHGHLVPLDADHPGFRDPVYRARRDAIARMALAYLPGHAVPDVKYTSAEQIVWRTASRHLAPLHRKLVCRELNELQDDLGLMRGSIPQLEELNRCIAPVTGFRTEPVAGLILAREFLQRLGEGVFLSTQYIRHGSRPLYTPEPDIIHEAIGHAASLLSPRISRVNRAFGRAAQQADDTELLRIERVYWFTLEFGLIREDGQVKAVGAGLLSSASELSNAAETLPWDLERMAESPYDPTRLQERLFVGPSFEAMMEETFRWLDDRRFAEA